MSYNQPTNKVLQKQLSDLTGCGNDEKAVKNRSCYLLSLYTKSPPTPCIVHDIGRKILLHKHSLAGTDLLKYHVGG